MKKELVPITCIFLVISTLLTSCQAIGDVFKAGVWVGVVVVVAIAALILYLVNKASGKK